MSGIGILFETYSTFLIGLAFKNLLPTGLDRTCLFTIAEMITGKKQGKSAGSKPQE
jgi:hypothetical protein